MNKVITTVNIRSAPDKPGVYAVCFGSVTKFGRSSNLFSRLQSYKYAVVNDPGILIHYFVTDSHIAVEKTILRLAKERGLPDAGAGPESFLCTEKDAMHVMVSAADLAIEMSVVNGAEDPHDRWPARMVPIFLALSPLKLKGIVTECVLRAAVRINARDIDMRLLDAMYTHERESGVPAIDTAEPLAVFIPRVHEASPFLSAVHESNPDFMRQVVVDVYRDLAQTHNPVFALAAVELGTADARVIFLKVAAQLFPSLIDSILIEVEATADAQLAALSPDLDKTSDGHAGIREAIVRHVSCINEEMMELTKAA